MKGTARRPLATRVFLMISAVLRYNPVVKKILVRVPQWLGDAVVSTVFLTRLKQREKEAQISVLCPSTLASLFETHPAVTSVLILPTPQKSIFTTGKMIRVQNFDEAYILPRSFRSALEAFLGRVPRRVGAKGDFRGMLLTESLPYQENRLYAHRNLALIHEESFPLESIPPFFPVSEPRNRNFLLLKKPLLGIAPISIAPSRTWLPERFVEVANEWQEKNGGTVVLFGSPKERTEVQKIAEGIKGAVVNTAGELSLPELGWMIQHCDRFLANDSGLMHVASAFKIPTVVLFGASNPAVALPPWGSFTALQHKEIPCVPCLRNHCARTGEDHKACLKAITTTEVQAQLSD